jgi:5-(carboxyamino)imidazole ribonucleotide mutase
MSQIQVAIVMGSKTDLEWMSQAADTLKEFDLPYEIKILSAHRSPQEMLDFAQAAKSRGLKIIIAGAGGAAHLPGMLASNTSLPVIGVPCPVGPLAGQDALYSIVQMPKGVPVATVGIGNATNAALLALRMLGSTDSKIAAQLDKYREDQKQKSLTTLL